jgi:phthiocerol/phenolphthiocerol synthesis type-I polyketide synthase E
MSDDVAAIAIIGMSGSFPGADNVTQFWDLLSNGKEGIRFLDHNSRYGYGSVEEDRNFVRAIAAMDSSDLFDNNFFGLSAREAELTDPQHRILLEHAWLALEDAGYDAKRYPKQIGVFAGATLNTYLLNNLISRSDIMGGLSPTQINIANGHDFLTTRISYKLNLRGPSHSVQSACSTSLVSIHCGCRSLLAFESDIVLAGGVSVNVTLQEGYKYEEGGINSPDGRCRTFDAEAKGTVFGSGVGVVALKRLEDALADGDFIHAVIRGTAVNNDGCDKGAFTAPSENGQADVIAEALGCAGLNPDAISYVECHGTATPLGDPIEVRALSKVFTGLPVGSCGLGSVKTNIGHLDAAAGVAGLIKVVLSMKHRMLPPSLHFKVPNPQIRFEDTPFYVNTELRPWVDNRGPLRAGVSAFGVGGTNAHIILEEAPSLKSVPVASDTYQVLPLSAKTSTALARSMDRLVAFLKKQGQENLGDIAYTLQVGRQRFPYRFALTCSNREQAIEVLEQERETIERECRPQEDGPPSIVFMFPGQGAQHSNMGRDLYKEEPVFRKFMDQCSEILQPHLGLDLARFLYEIGGPQSYVEERLTETWLAQPSIFAVEYSLSQLWISWGITPTAILGHSLGEYVAACVSGVMSLEDALRIVAVRGKLMQQTPKGAMLSIALSLEDFEKVRGYHGSEYHTQDKNQQFYPDTVVASLLPQTKPLALSKGRIPFLSNVTGTWINDDQTLDLRYWLLQGTPIGPSFNQPLKLEGVHKVMLLTLSVDSEKISLSENTFTEELRANFTMPDFRTDGNNDESPDSQIKGIISRLWEAGVELNWLSINHLGRRRVPLPTYPFERERFWIDPAITPARVSEDRRGSNPESTRAPSNGPLSKKPRPDLRNAFVPARTQIERGIAEIIELALGIHPIGVTDSFGDLGGDSLVAINVIASINSRFGCQLQVVDIFEAPTVKSLNLRILSMEHKAEFSDGSARKKNQLGN